VVYTGDHWVIDLVAGAAYAYVAYYVVVDAPSWLRVRAESAWHAITLRRRGAATDRP
jgi:hypothetical protein